MLQGNAVVLIPLTLLDAPTLMSAHYGACHDGHMHNDSVAPCSRKQHTFVSSPLLICDNIVCLLRPC